MTLRKTIPDLVAIVAFVLISLAYFFPADLEGRILFQHDTSAAAGSGREAVEYHERTGQVTRWTNALFGGMPTYQMMPSYDSTRPLTWIERVYRLFLPDYVCLCFILLLGFYILMRAFGLPPGLSALGAVAWAFSSYFFILISAGHLWKLITLAYVPPTLAGIVLAYRGRLLWGGLLTAVFVALQVTSNHVQMSYYFLLVILALVVAYGWQAGRSGALRQWVKASAVLLLAALIGVATNLSNLYHTYTYSKQTMRGPSELVHEGEAARQASGGLDRDYITAWSYGIGETWTLLVPNYQGGSSSATIGESRAAMKKAVPQYGSLYGSFAQYFGDQPWTAGPVYVGAMVVLLFVIGCFVVKGPLKWALVVATVLSILLSWGKNFMPLTDLFIDYVPMYDKFRAVSSILVIAELTIPLLAVLGLWELLKDPTRLRTPFVEGRRQTRWVLLAGGLTGLFLAYATGAADLTGYVLFIVAEGVHFYLVYRLLALRYGLLTVGLLHTLIPALAFALTPETFHAAFVTAMEQQMLQGAVDQGGIPAEELAGIVANLSEMRAALVSADAWRSVGVVAIGAVLLLLFARGRLKARTAVVSLCLLCLVDLWDVNKRYLNDSQFVEQTTRTQSFVKTATDEYILQDPALDYRVLNLATSSPFDENNTSYWHKSVGGYHAAKLRRYQDIIDEHLRTELSTIYRGLLRAGGDVEELDPLAFPVVNMLNTRYFILPVSSDGQTAPLPNPYALGNAWFVDEVQYVDNANEEIAALHGLDPARTAVVDRRFMADLHEAIERPTGPSGTITLTSYEPNHLVYQTDNAHDGVAVLSEIYYPQGWQATIDGRKTSIARANYILRALYIPAGQHTVDLRFDPQSLHVTEAIATTAFIILLLAALLIVVLEVRARRKGSTQGSTQSTPQGSPK